MKQHKGVVNSAYNSKTMFLVEYCNGDTATTIVDIIDFDVLSVSLPGHETIKYPSHRRNTITAP